MKKIIFSVFIILLIIPIFLIAYLTFAEMEKYNVDYEYSLTQRAYGEYYPIQVGNIKEEITLEGKFKSDQYEFQIFEIDERELVRRYVDVESEVNKGQKLVGLSEKVIDSDYKGIIKDIKTNDTQGYVKILNLEEVHFVSSIEYDSIIIDALKEPLKTESEEELSLKYQSNIIDSGKTNLVFQIDNSNNHYRYNQNHSFTIRTGREAEDVVIVPRGAIYQYEENGPYYIRLIDDHGLFIDEVVVEIGISNKEFVSIVSDIDIHMNVDLGYAGFINQ